MPAIKLDNENIGGHIVHLYKQFRLLLLKNSVTTGYRTIRTRASHSHDDLHWLDVPQRVQYKLAVMVHRCLGRRAPSYLADYCVPVSTVPGRQHLRSASRCQLIVPRVRRSTFGARAFAIAGPTVWNSLPDSLRDPAVGPDQFRRDLKTHLFE